MQPLPASFSLGPFTIHMYGLIIAAGIVAGTSVVVWCASKLPKKSRSVFTSERIWNGLTWAIIGGVVGARAYHVVDQWAYYKEHLSLIPAVWNGGLGIYGGLAGGVLALYYYTKKEQINLVTALDIASLGLPLGQAIGRIGNYINQELYGLPTNLPWGIYIPPEARHVSYSGYEYFHPLFAYESVSMLIVFMILQAVFHYQKLPIGKGYFAASYLVGYALSRGLLESYRIDPWMVGGRPVAQLISLIIIIGISSWMVYHRLAGRRHT